MYNKKTILAIYIIVIFSLVLLPINNNTSKINHTYIFKLRFDYTLHALLFLPWILFKQNKSVNYHTFTWISIGLLFAVVAEGVQYFVPYRAFNVNDLIANCIGILLSSLFLYLPLNKQRA